MRMPIAKLSEQRSRLLEQAIIIPLELQGLIKDIGQFHMLELLARSGREIRGMDRAQPEDGRNEAIEVLEDFVHLFVAQQGWCDTRLHPFAMDLDEKVPDAFWFWFFEIAGYL